MNEISLNLTAQKFNICTGKKGPGNDFIGFSPRYSEINQLEGKNSERMPNSLTRAAFDKNSVLLSIVPQLSPPSQTASEKAKGNEVSSWDKTHHHSGSKKAPAALWSLLGEWVYSS